MSLSKVIEIARGELGNTEYPAGSNLQKYGAAYGANGVPYCVQFLWWCFREAGESKAFFNGGKTASCTRLKELYEAEGRWFTDGNYQKGDIPIMTFAKNREIQHCGLIIDKSDDGGWVTVEGNTSPGLEGTPQEQANGGCVAKKVRYKANILGVCRPDYQPEPILVDDIAGRWSEADIRLVLDYGLMKGYPDGSFKPTQAVTREELATVLARLVGK